MSIDGGRGGPRAQARVLAPLLGRPSCCRCLPLSARVHLLFCYAVFSVFEFHFTYALTLIHTVTTMFGMQGFLRVRGCPPTAPLACAGGAAAPAPAAALLLCLGLMLPGLLLVGGTHLLPPCHAATQHPPATCAVIPRPLPPGGHV